MLSLGKVAGLCRKCERAHMDGYETGFTIDYGEWSGKACMDAMDAELDKISQQHGFRDYDQLLDTITAVTGHRWVYFNMPHNRSGA